MIACLWIALAAAQDFDSSMPERLEKPPEGLGLGLVVGDPNGVALSSRKDASGWYQMGLGWSFVEGRFSMNADQVWTLYTIPAAEAGGPTFPLYAGIGGRVRLGEVDRDGWVDIDRWNVGVRIPMGVVMYPEQTGIDIFVEVAPTLLLVPKTAVGMGVGMGARFYFF